MFGGLYISERMRHLKSFLIHAWDLKTAFKQNAHNLDFLRKEEEKRFPVFMMGKEDIDQNIP